MIKIRFEFNLFINKVKEEKAQTPPVLNAGGTDSDADEEDACFFQSLVEEIRHRESLMSHSTIENYRTVLRSFAEYLGKDISLSEMKPELIKGYENWLIEKGVLQNSISCYMRSLRSLISSVCGSESKDYFPGIHWTYQDRQAGARRAGYCPYQATRTAARHLCLPGSRPLYVQSLCLRDALRGYGLPAQEPDKAGADSLFPPQDPAAHLHPVRAVHAGDNQPL